MLSRKGSPGVSWTRWWEKSSTELAKLLSRAQAALQKGAKGGSLPPNSAYLVARIMAKQDSQKEKAASTLEQLLKQNKGLFLFRREAEELLAQLKSEMN